MSVLATIVGALDADLSTLADHEFTVRAAATSWSESPAQMRARQPSEAHKRIAPIEIGAPFFLVTQTAAAALSS
jgi:hypothetical protein